MTQWISFIYLLSYNRNFTSEKWRFDTILCFKIPLVLSSQHLYLISFLSLPSEFQCSPSGTQIFNYSSIALFLFSYIVNADHLCLSIFALFFFHDNVMSEVEGISNYRGKMFESIQVEEREQIKLINRSRGHTNENLSSQEFQMEFVRWLT